MKVQNVGVSRLQVLEQFCHQLDPLLFFRLERGVKALSGFGNLLERSLFLPDMVNNFMGGDGIDECTQSALSTELALPDGFDDAQEDFTPDIFPIGRGAADGIFYPIADLRPILEENFFGSRPFSFWQKRFPFDRGSEGSGIPQAYTFKRLTL